MQKRKPWDKPHKLGEFCSPAGSLRHDNGACPSSHTHTSRQAAHSEEKGRGQPQQQHHDTDSSQSNVSSPVRQKRRLSVSQAQLSETPFDCDPVLPCNPYEEKLAAFPTTGTAVLDTDMKEMFQALRGALEYDMRTFMQTSRKETHTV